MMMMFPVFFLFFPSICHPTYCGTRPDMYSIADWMVVIGVVILVRTGTSGHVHANECTVGLCEDV